MHRAWLKHGTGATCRLLTARACTYVVDRYTSCIVHVLRTAAACRAHRAWHAGQAVGMTCVCGASVPNPHPCTHRRLGHGAAGRRPTLLRARPLAPRQPSLCAAPAIPLRARAPAEAHAAPPAATCSVCSCGGTACHNLQRAQACVAGGAEDGVRQPVAQLAKLGGVGVVASLLRRYADWPLRLALVRVRGITDLRQNNSYQTTVVQGAERRAEQQVRCRWWRGGGGEGRRGQGVHKMG